MTRLVKPLISVASRTDPLQESVIREMTRLGDVSGAVPLSQGLPDFPPPREIVDAAVAALQDGHHQYTFPFGDPAFRFEIARKYREFNDIEADPETEVTVTCGVSEGLVAAVLALTDPGDEVIILEPWYENYVPACLLAGVKPRFVSLLEPDYTLDIDGLEEAAGSGTRLIILNTPHNPTGRVLELRELEAIADICYRHDLIAVVDEIYERIIYEGSRHVSLGSLDQMRDRTVTISGLGKTYAVTGWRVGWVVAPQPLSQRVRKVHDYLTVCAPAAFQQAGIVALRLPEDYYLEQQRLYEGRRKLLLGALDALQIRYSSPQGAYYVMGDFGSIDWPRSDYERDGWTVDRAFAEYMARDIGVGVVPGSSFYAAERFPQSLRVRFNFAKRDETLREAADRLARMR